MVPLLCVCSSFPLSVPTNCWRSLLNSATFPMYLRHGHFKWTVQKGWHPLGFPQHSAHTEVWEAHAVSALCDLGFWSQRVLLFVSPLSETPVILILEWKRGGKMTTWATPARRVCTLTSMEVSSHTSPAPRNGRENV